MTLLVDELLLPDESLLNDEPPLNDELLPDDELPPDDEPLIQQPAELLLVACSPFDEIPPQAAFAIPLPVSSYLPQERSGVVVGLPVESKTVIGPWKEIVCM